jgi:two-component system sensor histidine kinase AlgZ
MIVSNPITASKVQTRPNNGMALENIRQRLNIYYKNKAQLTITNRDNVYRVKVVIPKHIENSL